jgi:hypothetical protein
MSMMLPDKGLLLQLAVSIILLHAKHSRLPYTSYICNSAADTGTDTVLCMLVLSLLSQQSKSRNSGYNSTGQSLQNISSTEQT